MVAENLELWQEFLTKSSLVLRGPFFIWIDGQQNLFKTGRLQLRMRNNSLQASKPFRVSPRLYQECLRYTMLARLAPAWNKAGDWLIQGRDFITHSGYANAVKCELVANPDELYISVCAVVLTLAPLQLADLNLSQLEIQSLLYNAEHNKGGIALQNVWCRVMPSMKKGRLCSISLSIPIDSPFASYRDLKRHWKNTVSFWATGGKQFTYPSICLRTEPLRCVPRVEPRPILSAFLQDLTSKVPTACGQHLRFQPQVRHPVSGLHSASKEVAGPGPNLSKRKKTEGKQVPLRDPRDLLLVNQTRQQSPAISQTLLLKAQSTSDKHIRKGMSPSVSQSQCRVYQNASDPEQELQLSSISIPPKPVQGFMVDELTNSEREERGQQSKNLSSIKSGLDFEAVNQKSKLQLSDVSVTAAEMIFRRNEVFLLNSPCDSKPEGPCSALRDKATPDCSIPCRPVENKQVTYLSSTEISRLEELSQTANISASERASRDADLESSTTSVVRIDETDSCIKNTEIPKFAPVFKAKKSSGSSTKDYAYVSSSGRPGNHMSHGGESSGKIVPVFKSKMIKSKNTNQVKTVPQTLPTKLSDSAIMSCPLVTSSTEERSLPSYPATFKFPARKSYGKKDIKTPFRSCEPNMSEPKTPIAGKLKQKMDAVRVAGKTCAGSTETLPVSGFVGGLGSPLFSVSKTVTSSQGKRRIDAQNSADGGQVKKARSRPQVQEVDVEMLARCDQLNKVNTVTLNSWLRERGIQCKSKDKKSDLVDRVKNFLSITSAEL